jgi:hypothetical protein
MLLYSVLVLSNQSLQGMNFLEYYSILLRLNVKLNKCDSALARIGKSVLHLDTNEYYGGSWTSFNFQELLDWAQLLQGCPYCLVTICKRFLLLII